MAFQQINIGSQGNDGTGDTIREAFQKVNDNFRFISTSTATILAGLYFTDLDDVPKELEHDYILVNDTYTNTVTQKLLVGGPTITLTTSSNTITVTNINKPLIRGTYLTGNSYDGNTATTWSVDVGSPGVATSSTIVARDSNGDIWFNIGHGIATSAYYADLAENYVADAQYDAGTVVVFGGVKEITISKNYMSRNVAGVISTNPAYLMNSGCNGLPVALQGRVPCKVIGEVNKGDMLVSSAIAGVAVASEDPKIGAVIGKALENYNSAEIGIIEVVVGRV
jgi:hypothetical protein